MTVSLTSTAAAQVFGMQIEEYNGELLDLAHDLGRRCVTRNSNSRYQPSCFCVSWCNLTLSVRGSTGCSRLSNRPQPACPTRGSTSRPASHSPASLRCAAPSL